MSRLVEQWIAAAHDESPVRANSLIITVYGDSIAPHGGTVWLGSLIRLVVPLGLNPRVVRTSVFQLSREGWLQSEQIGRRSYYSLTAAGRRRFEHAYRRIHLAPKNGWDGDWQIVISTGSGLSAAQRDTMRKEPLWGGFGAIAPGILAHPSADPDVLLDVLHGTGVHDNVVVLKARNIGPLASRPLAELVRACWNLEWIAAGYRRFVERFRPLLRALRNARNRDPQQCFAVRTLLIHEVRRVLLRDPQLPAQLRPLDWLGAAARQLCRDLYLVTCREAERHLHASLETTTGALPQAEPEFYECFGGFPPQVSPGAGRVP